MNDWNPGLYLRFSDERARPARDLIAAIPVAATRIVDLGCGPGNSTELLIARFPHADIIGVDSSPSMLATARKRIPGVTFVEADVSRWMPDQSVDLIFANALFQWVPGHVAVLARLMGALAPGGVLAIQMPDNLGEPSHRLMRVTAEEGPWAMKFSEPVAREPIAPPEAYYDALSPRAARVDIWHTIYNHPLANAASIVEMIRSTGLRPYVDRLNDADAALFIADYTRRIGAAYPALADGRVLFRFPRLFVVALAKSA